ncbi:MAG: polysaccharide biosynthesis C-terminal domain-containing protein [Bacteroidetes bacterium]|nr:polysaccharide biosynthesis C-terminal domain-containing protein [Bacteroidota bacterium]
MNAKADVLMLGMLSDVDSVGVYSIALRLSEMIAFFLFAFNVIMAPMISEYYSKGQTDKLQGLMRVNARILLFLSIPVIVILILFGPFILSLFGSGFTSGDGALSILVGGQFINIMAGSVGYLLLMTKNERLSVISMGTSTLINIILNAILIPLWNIEGAAIATAVSVIIWNVMMLYYAKTKLGINPTAFSFSKRVSHDQ